MTSSALVVLQENPQPRYQGQPLKQEDATHENPANNKEHATNDTTSSATSTCNSDNGMRSITMMKVTPALWATPALQAQNPNAFAAYSAEKERKSMRQAASRIQESKMQTLKEAFVTCKIIGSSPGSSNNSTSSTTSSTSLKDNVNDEDEDDNDDMEAALILESNRDAQLDDDDDDENNSSNSCVQVESLTNINSSNNTNLQFRNNTASFSHQNQSSGYREDPLFQQECQPLSSAAATTAATGTTTEPLTLSKIWDMLDDSVVTGKQALVAMVAAILFPVVIFTVIYFVGFVKFVLAVLAVLAGWAIYGMVRCYQDRASNGRPLHMHEPGLMDHHKVQSMVMTIPNYHDQMNAEMVPTMSNASVAQQQQQQQQQHLPEDCNI